MTITKPKIDWNKPVRTVVRSVPVTILTTQFKADQPVVGILHEIEGDELHTWSQEGAFSQFGRPSALDLENVPEMKRTVKFWLNVYGDAVGQNACHATREGADAFAAHNRRFACIKIEATEGEGL